MDFSYNNYCISSLVQHSRKQLFRTMFKPKPCHQTDVSQHVYLWWEPEKKLDFWKVSLCWFLCGLEFSFTSVILFVRWNISALYGVVVHWLLSADQIHLNQNRLPQDAADAADSADVFPVTNVVCVTLDVNLNVIIFTQWAMNFTGTSFKCSYAGLIFGCAHFLTQKWTHWQSVWDVSQRFSYHLILCFLNIN